MKALPADIVPSTRRQYAQLMAKVLKLAVYHCRVIGQSPLPPGFLPRLGRRRPKRTSTPWRTRRSLARKGPARVPAAVRLPAREGMRYGEAMRLTWADLDLARGSVTLDTNKTDDPRAWALARGAAAALAAHRPDDSGDDALGSLEP